MSPPRPSVPHQSSSAYVPQPEALVLPDGAVNEEAVELLQDLVGTHHHQEVTLVGQSEEDDGVLSKDDKRPPWYKRTSPWWMVAFSPLSAIAMASTIAPKLEIYTMLACSVYKPEYVANMDLRYLGIPYHPEDPFLPPPPARTGGDMTLGSNDTFVEVHFPEPGPRVAAKSTNKCTADPVVQGAVARLISVLVTVMGILTCITTAWWGSYSDRSGRTRVLGISSLGLLLNDTTFILVAKFSTHMPGRYWWLLVGSICEGLCGGMATGVGASHAYVADTTNPHNRSRIFSTALGLMFSGIAIGPTLGALLVRSTHYTLSVFYFATSVHIFYFIFVTFIIPEPVSKTSMASSAAKHRGQLEEHQNADKSVTQLARTVFGFLTPLAVFAPTTVETKKGKTRRDYNMLLVALCSGCVGAVLGGYPFKFQYATYQFGWTTETLGYAITVIGVMRASFLTIILPIALKFLKPAPIQIPQEDEEPLDGSGLRKAPALPSPRFDLNLARVSLLWESCMYIGMAILTSQYAFAALTVAGSFGSGLNPALQSVACAMYARVGGTENGKLFGALAVVQAISSTIVGPSMFGTLYIRTVQTFPQAILVLAAGLVASAAACVLLIRLPKEGEVVDIEEEADTGESGSLLDHGREATLVDVSTA